MQWNHALRVTDLVQHGQANARFKRYQPADNPLLCAIRGLEACFPDNAAQRHGKSVALHRVTTTMPWPSVNCVGETIEDSLHWLQSYLDVSPRFFGAMGDAWKSRAATPSGLLYRW